MTLEGKEMVVTRITWGELEGAYSERGETTEFHTNHTLKLYFLVLFLCLYHYNEILKPVSVLPKH